MIDSKIKLVTDAIGSRQNYSYVMKKYSFTDEEKNILLHASSNIKKPNPDKQLIYKVHQILISKSFEYDETITESKADDTVSKTNLYPKIGKKSKLMNCPDCDKEISKNAKSCPHCGTEIKSKKKTHWFTWLVLLILISWFIGALSEKKEATNGYSASSVKEKNYNSNTFTAKKVSEKCTKSDFEVIKGREWREGSYYKVAYQIKNNCNYDYAVQLQINYFGENGSIIRSKTIYPARSLSD